MLSRGKHTFGQGIVPRIYALRPAACDGSCCGSVTALGCESNIHTLKLMSRRRLFSAVRPVALRRL